MSFPGLNHVADLLTLLAATIGAFVLTGVGLAIEYVGLQAVQNGQLVVGLWEVTVGTLLLVTGCYLLGYKNVWRRLAQSSQSE